jgi:type IV pilus assembly protein PilB
MENNSEEKEMKKRLGQMLLETGYIDELQLAAALGRQKEQGSPLGTHLLKLGFVNDRNLSEILKKQLGIQWVTLFDRKISEEAMRSVPIDIAVKYTVMPLAYDGKTITIAITNPSDLEQIDSLSFQLGKKIKPYMTLESDIENAIAKHYQAEEQKQSEIIGHGKDIRIQHISKLCCNKTE